MFNDTSNENLSNKGIQVDLGEYLEYKKQFNDTRTISYSSSDLYHKRKNEQEEARSDFFIYGGASAVSAKVLYEKAKKDEGIRALISEVPGAKLLKQKLTKQYLDNQAAQIISGAIDPRSTAVAPLSQSLQSILVSLEELSPSQILKTLQLSSFNSLFVEVIDEERKKARHIKQTSIQVYENYYKNLILKESKIKLSDEDIKHGFILQNNKLYQAVPVAGNKGEVKAGRVLLDYATVVNSTVKTGDNHHSVNRVFEKFTNIYDANLSRSQLHTEPFVIVGGASKKSTVATWARAYGRFSLEIGAKSLDNPLGFLEEYLDMTGLNNSKLVKNKYFQTAKGFTNFKLGTGGVYNISSAEMMKKIGKNLAIKGAAGVVGLNIVDATLDALTPDSSVWSSGLVAGMADTFMKAHVKFAELWSDNFQDLKKSQENSAPESTKLSTLIGVPLAGAMTGANLAFFKRVRDTATKGLEQSATIHTAEQRLGGLLGKAADKVGINIVGNTLSRYSKVGALLGATLTLPFLPGALVGKSSEELRQEYSGEKEVAVRKDRGWLAGGTEYEGGQIKYFRQNLLRTIASDAKTKTLYGDRETKRRLDPVFNPIKYLRNPYRFEEMHQEDMPFPVWGMDVSYGSVLGQLYKGTVGELIKPTVIHPEFLKLQSEANPNLVLGVKGEIAKGISETISGKNSKTLSKLSAGNGEENSDTSIAIVDSDAYTTPENERKEVKSLIADGLMLRANAPTASVLDRTLAGTSASLSDFTGLKGFSSSLLLGAANLNPTEQLRPELEVSGSSTSFSDTLSDANLGDMLGFGEFSRRLIPQSAAVKRDTVNPMRNQVAPDWLPKNETKYYKNFERGNYYSHMENGEYLLPGSKGFETLNPELKGVDPNNYPLVYQYKILQNVARGSSEHIAVKKYLAEHLDELSEKEKDVFFEAYGQDTERDVQKRFTDYKTGSEKSNMGVIGLTQNAIWESFSHLESPLEPLTPFRPMAKFVHQRTAVEDYIKTQLMGSDVGIWTNPYSHFLKPTLNRLADSGSIDQFKPKEAIEKENIDTYFDKLSLVKAIKTNDTYDIERNITALSYLGINDPGSMKRFKSALPEGQSAYVEAFSQEKDKKKRNQILSLVPKDIGRAYQSIWSNIDIYDQAILKGKDPNKALEEEYLKDSKKLKSAFSIDITRQDRETIHNQASTLANDEDKKRFEQYQEAKLIRLKAAQKEATEYVENQTGSLPSDNWIGWDPRLTIDDIKLKTLTIGREDIHRFGYWQKDLERSERLIGLKEGEIVNELENIKAEKRSNVAREFAIRSRLRNIGFEVSTINSVPSNSNQLKITDKQEYLRAYNNSV